MASRPLMIATLLGASVGVPYVVSHSQNGTLGNWMGAKTTATPSAAADAVSPTPPHAQIQGTISGPIGLAPPIGSAGAIGFNGVAPLPRTQVMPIEQVLRFDLTKEWVYQQWPRKTTGPSDVGLFSVRVPLVTGTQLYDLAGSLTYFFNSSGALEHISFRGRTGDPARLTQFLMRTYELENQAAPPGEQLLQVKRSGYPQSELRTRPEAVLRSTAPLSSFAVELELARPGSKRMLPPRPVPLDIPPDATAATPSAAPNGDAAATASGDANGAESGGDSYFDKVRYATPDEESQIYRMRWPN